MKKRIYLIGNAFGSYRARALIEFLGSSPKFAYYYADPRYLSPNKPTLFRRVLLKGSRIIDRFYSLSKLQIADLLYVLPMSNLNGLERLFVKILSKTVITEFYISQYDTYINDRKTVKPATWKAKKLLSIDQRLIDISTELIFLNNAEKVYYLDIARRGNTEKEIHIIPIATMSKKKAALPYTNNENSVLTLCWWGTFIPLHGLEKIIGAAEILKTKNVSFKMYLFGSSEELSQPYKSLVEEKQLSDYVFIDNNKHFSDHSLEDFLASHCDIAFGNFGDSVKARTVLVNKIVEAASMGIPVISQETAGLTEYFEDNKSIVFAKPTPEGIAEKIMEVMKKKTLLLNIAKQSHEVYRNNFSKDSYIRQISRILSSDNA
jgi:glycosyltransferase involved in cell wall biosynthesis